MSYNEFYARGKILPRDYNPRRGTIRRWLAWSAFALIVAFVYFYAWGWV